MCPNGHGLMVIDGSRHPLASQECSAYCGMANRQNDKDWLCCSDCQFKVCHDCFHCASGHEMQSVQSEIFVTDDQPVCSSCENEIAGRMWICEKIAKASKTGNNTADSCPDKSQICQECLGSGQSFVTKSNHQASVLEDSKFDEEETKYNTQEFKKSAAALVADIFGTTNQNENEPVTDPFSMIENEKSQVASTTEVGGGTGGGWDENEDDIDIE